MLKALDPATVGEILEDRKRITLVEPSQATLRAMHETFPVTALSDVVVNTVLGERKTEESS